MKTSARATRSQSTLHSKMGIDRSQMQIMRVRVQRKDGGNFSAEFAVPCLGSHEELESIVVEAVGDPIKLAGEWRCEDVTREMWDEV